MRITERSYLVLYHNLVYGCCLWTISVSYEVRPLLTKVLCTPVETDILISLQMNLPGLLMDYLIDKMSVCW